MKHHAYFLEGETNLLREVSDDVRAREHIKANDPDFLERAYEKFGVEEAAELKTLASFRSAGAKSFFIIAISSITTEAQQALLKLLEEPRAGLTLVLVVPHGTLLPTLRSRMLAYPEKLKFTAQKVSESQVLTFLKAPNKARSVIITELLKDDEGTRERVRAFLNGLEVELHAKLLESHGKKEFREALEDVACMRSYAGDRSPSFKMLLEHLALALPKI
jgi:DNA polymerase III delta prime subunit